MLLDVLSVKEESSSDHLFFKCTYTFWIWNAITSSLQVNHIPHSSFSAHEAILKLLQCKLQCLISDLRLLALLSCPCVSIFFGMYEERGTKEFLFPLESLFPHGTAFIYSSWVLFHTKLHTFFVSQERTVHMCWMVGYRRKPIYKDSSFSNPLDQYYYFHGLLAICGTINTSSLQIEVPPVCGFSCHLNFQKPD